MNLLDSYDYIVEDDDDDDAAAGWITKNKNSKIQLAKNNNSLLRYSYWNFSSAYTAARNASSLLD